MRNAWDIAFIFMLIMAAWAGWRLKSLLLLGIGFALALAPLAGRQWERAVGNFLVEELGGKGLEGRQFSVAYWLIVCATAVALFLLFKGFSKMLKSLQMEALDRGFGSFIVCGTLLAVLSLNLQDWSSKLSPKWRGKLEDSWFWDRLRPGKAPEWAEKMEQNLPDLSKIAPKTSGRSRKKASRQ